MLLLIPVQVSFFCPVFIILLMIEVELKPSENRGHQSGPTRRQSRQVFCPTRYPEIPGESRWQDRKPGLAPLLLG